MVEEIHCNINHPEYYNIYIADKRSKEAVIYDGKQYKTDTKNIDIYRQSYTRLSIKP